MDGRVCSEERCNCVDFLPFECSLCGGVFCLEHRSRFSHTCNALKVSQPLVTAVKGPSVKDMMDAVEHRFDGATNGNHKEHFNVKSSADTVHTDEKFAKKIHNLDSIAENSASAKQRKISMKAKEMLIKTKAVGNSSIAGVDRFFLCVHFADSMADAEADADHKVEYMFFSSTKTIGEVMQQIWQKYYSTVEETRGFRENATLTGAKRDDLALVLSTADATQWKHWDRNWALKDCLANYEDIAVFATTVESVMRNQEEQSAARAQAAALAEEAAARAAAEAEANKPKVKQYTFTKGQLAWYYKVSAEETAALSIAEMVETQPMIMVNVTAVHLDDFPNVYYTVKMKKPLQRTAVAGSLALQFQQEKQTDHTHLLPLTEPASSASGASTSASAGSVAPAASSTNKAGNAATDRAEQAAAARFAALDLQQTLSAMGIAIPIKVGFSNRDYNMTIGSECSVAQLKSLISAITDVSVPDMKLIVKGTVLKSNTQLIKDTKIANNTKVVVMSSGAHVV